MKRFYENIKKHLKKGQRGDELLEFSLTLPLMMVFTAVIGFGTWLFYTQVVADISAVGAARESGLNRGNNQVYVGAGYDYFSDAAGSLSSSQTAGVIGTPNIVANFLNRMIRLNVTGSASWNFGPLFGEYSFGGGGSSRIHLFYPGPPSPWE